MKVFNHSYIGDDETLLELGYERLKGRFIKKGKKGNSIVSNRRNIKTSNYFYIKELDDLWLLIDLAIDRFEILLDNSGVYYSKSNFNRASISYYIYFDGRNEEPIRVSNHEAQNIYIKGYVCFDLKDMYEKIEVLLKEMI